jgi:hypothetical protein
MAPSPSLWLRDDLAGLSRDLVRGDFAPDAPSIAMPSRKATPHRTGSAGSATLMVGGIHIYSARSL